jgi:phage terminase large subunit-like protein
VSKGSSAKPDPDLKHSVAAVQYAEGVRAGLISACKWIRLACNRFLDDLAWQDDDDFRFYYDATAAEKACNFIEDLPHIKGKWAAKGMTLTLEAWQSFFVANLFGWLRKKDDTRRFRTAILIVPRKNGKSALAAGIGWYMFVADNEHGAEVYSGATTERQAWEVFGPARMMGKRTPDLCEAFGVDVNAKNMNVVDKAAKFEPIIGNPGDGASPSCGIVDEYHEHKDDKQFDTLQTGMGARDQPIMLVITTAGDNIAGPCYALQERAQAMLEGTRPADDIFAMIYGVDPDDDWQDEAALIKANPNYEISISADFLRARQQEAMVSPRKQAIFKTKHLNIWVQSREAYFDVQKFKSASDENIRPEDFADWPAIIGIDLAEKRDLCAVEIIFQEPDVDKPRYAAFGRYYCPADTIEPPAMAGSSAKTPEAAITEMLQEWRDSGLLIETAGATSDDRVIKEDIIELARQFNVQEIAFDPWHSRQMALELSEEGMTCVEFRNSPSNMNEPMRELDALITDRRLLHDGNRAFQWMLGNVVNGARRGSHDLHRPDKEKPENKIDGPVARIMALGRFLLDETEAPLKIGSDYSAG